VDGFRLDAAQHLFDHLTREGRAQSVAWWRSFRDSLRATHPNVYLIGEVWSGPEVVREFYQGLDGCFNFGLAERLTQAVARGSADSLAQLRADLLRYRAQLPPGAVDCTFLSNHDQTRIASRLGGDPAKLKRALSELLALPGMPWLYYGEELGMRGRKPDPNLREPFVWGESDALQTRWMRPRYSVPDSVRSLAEQQKDTASVYAHYRRALARWAGR
jgi:glycosidase